MKKITITIAAAGVAVLLASCTDKKKPAAADPGPFECIAAKVTIGTNSIDTVVRYSKVTGEAQLLNAASFASKVTGAQGNIVGWVPLGDLRNAVQELMQREQEAQQNVVTPAPAATATPAATKKRE